MTTTKVAGFSSAFYGDPSFAFYTGAGATARVPWPWPIAIGGRPYLVDLKSGDWIEQFEPRVRDAVFQGSSPDEAAISVAGMWRFARSSWHLGAGQERADGADASPYRFASSSGIDPWTREQVTLLNSATAATSPGTGQCKMLVASNRLWFLSITTASQVLYTSSSTLASWTSATSMPGVAPTDFTTDGTDLYVTFGASGVYKVNGSTAVATQIVTTGTVSGVIGFARGRLLCSNGASIYDITANIATPAALPTALYTHPSPGFTWTGFVGGRTGIYAIGYSGDRTTVYRIKLNSAGTALDPPVAVIDLPVTEVGYSIGAYLGYVFLGLDSGVRFCEETDQGNLIVGPRLPTGGPVRGFSGWREWVWFTIDNAGLGRLSVANLVGPQQPAWASDLAGVNSGSVNAVATWGGKRYFTQGNVPYYETSTPVASGTIDLGLFTYGIPDLKTPARIDLRTQPLNGSVAAELKLDEGSFVTVGTAATAGSTSTVLRPVTTQGSRLTVRLTLTSSGGVAPIVEWVQTRAFPSPGRGRVIQVPVILHDVVKVDGADEQVDVIAERDFLYALVLGGQPTTYQEGERAEDVIVENVEWRPRIEGQSEVTPHWQGVALVQMRTIAT